MTDYVFRAFDTDTAMEKAIRELGDDAMILSVKRVGDMTEVRAVKEVSVVSQPVWENPRSQSLPTEHVTHSSTVLIHLSIAGQSTYVHKHVLYNSSLFIIFGDHIN